MKYSMSVVPSSWIAIAANAAFTSASLGSAASIPGREPPMATTGAPTLLARAATEVAAAKASRWAHVRKARASAFSRSPVPALSTAEAATFRSGVATRMAPAIGPPASDSVPVGKSPGRRGLKPKGMRPSNEASAAPSSKNGFVSGSFRRSRTMCGGEKKWDSSPLMTLVVCSQNLVRKTSYWSVEKLRSSWSLLIGGDPGWYWLR
mmetsp:Transcript_21998/g.52349  ORF Transcript_21998/g.52349 Transcript_21998/m.52349 type:complete len:206 (-) Transcript_21998:678-1295(-)